MARFTIYPTPQREEQETSQPLARPWFSDGALASARSASCASYLGYFELRQPQPSRVFLLPTL